MTFSATTKDAIRKKTTALETVVYFFSVGTETHLFRYEPKDKTSADNNDTVLVSAKGLRFVRTEFKDAIFKPIFKVPLIFEHIEGAPKVYTMANNLFAGFNVITARQTKTFAEAGLNENNTDTIYEIAGGLKSWRPGRTVNAINGFSEGVSYYVIMKTSVDVGASLIIPPIPAIDETATVVSKRNYEVTLNNFSSGMVTLRKQTSGIGVSFYYISNGSGGAGRWLAGVANGTPQTNLDENINAKLSGYPNGNFTFGVDGIEYYAKYNGVEFFRQKQIEVLLEGTAELRDIYTNQVTPLTPVYLNELVSDKLALDAKIIDDNKLGFKQGFVTGSIQAGGTALTLASDADAAKVAVGDLMYIEPTNTARGIKGLKTWPNAGVPNISDLAAYTGSNFTWVHANGLTYEKYGSEWAQKKDVGINYYNSNYYIETALPLGLRIRVLSKAGRILTVDAPPDISANGAKVWFDNEERFNSWFGWGSSEGSDGITLRFRTGVYFFGEYINIYRWKNFSLIGSNTIFTACPGSASMELKVGFCDGYKQLGIKMQSNVGVNGWGPRNYPRQLGGNVVAPGSIDLLAAGLSVGDSVNCNVEVEVADTFTSGLGMSNCINGLFKARYTHSAGVKRYNAWAIVTTDGSVNNTIHDSSFDSPTQFGGFEAFGGVGNKFLNITSKNGYLSSNTSEEMHIENLALTYTANSRVPGQELSDPSINFNQNTGRADGKFGGSVKNATIHFEDFVDTDGNFKKGIVIQDGYNNAVIDNVIITYTKPFVNNGTAQIGCLGILSTGLNTIVRNSKVFGANKPHTPLFMSNIGVLDGLLENCEATTLFLGTGIIRNCKATTIYHGAGVTFEGTNIGTKILV